MNSPSRHQVIIKISPCDNFRWDQLVMPFPSIDGKDDLCDAFAGLIVISEETQMCTMSKLCVNTSLIFSTTNIIFQHSYQNLWMGLYHQMPCTTSIVLVYKCCVIDIFSVSNFYFFLIAVLSTSNTFFDGSRWHSNHWTNLYPAIRVPSKR